MRGIFVDIQNELADLEKEAALLADSLELIEREARKDETWSWLVVQGLASGIEKIYTGCERVMDMIAREIDGAPVSHAEGWHASLLKRIANPFPGVREAAISEDTYAALDRLRSFRHRERNSYGLSLDPEIVVERAGEAKGAFTRFQANIVAFTLRHQDP